MSSLVSSGVRSVAGKITRSALETRSSRPPASMNTSPLAAMSAVELVDRAGAGRLVVAPALHLGAVADAAVGDVVEGDLDDELGAQGDPLELVVGAPARRVGAAALAAGVG